jgi:hypothetical protein
MVGKLVPEFFPKIRRHSRTLDDQAVAKPSPSWQRRSVAARGDRRRLYQDRGREHGERDQEISAARL